MASYPAIRSIDSDEIFKLLPFHIRQMDPGALLAYLTGMADNHNFIAELCRELPALQDPSQCGVWSPTDFGEDPELFAVYKQLVENEEQASDYGLQIANKLQKSIVAWRKEQFMLASLGNAVGNKTYARHTVASTRQMIKSAIARHAIKGTQPNFYLIGRMLGFIDIKAGELWTRFSLTEPEFPSSINNNSDFASRPEQFPYWPLDSVYTAAAAANRYYERFGVAASTSSGLFQYPAPSYDYDPNVIDDGGLKVVEYLNVSARPSDTNYYINLINGKNPWGNFKANFVGRFKTGQYVLSGGTKQSLAFVDVDVVENGVPSTVRFEAHHPGEWANGTSILIKPTFFVNRFKFVISGKISKIKFKSSLFDLTAAVDPMAMCSFLPPVPVRTVNGGGAGDPWAVRTPTVIEVASGKYVNTDHVELQLKTAVSLPVGTTVFLNGMTGGVNGLRTVTGSNGKVLTVGRGYGDELLGGFVVQSGSETPTVRYGRLSGEFPLTGHVDGTWNQALPETHWQLNYLKFLQIISTLRAMVEDARPITRQVRREYSGLLMSDDFRYAPITAIDRVILQSPNGNKWELVVRNVGGVFTADFGVFDADGEFHREPTDPNAVVTDIYQRDRLVSRQVKWGVDNDGRFAQELLTVFVRQDNVNIKSGAAGGWVYVHNGQLVVRSGSPESVSESIWSDDTLDETSLHYGKYFTVENPSEAAAPYLSDDASSADTPPDQFNFTAPQDDIVPKIEFPDGFAGHREPTPDADTLDDRYTRWRYNPDFFVGSHLRNRAVGADPFAIQPPLKAQHADYPIGFMDGAGEYVYRDRVSNTLRVGHYIADTDDVSVGGSLVERDIEFFDGPIEGADQTPLFPPDVASAGQGVTPNNQWGNIGQWNGSLFRIIDVPPAYLSVSNDGGNAAFDFGTLPEFVHPGCKFVVDAGPYAGVHLVKSVSGSVTTDTDFVEDDAQPVWWRGFEFEPWFSRGNGKAVNVKVTVDSKQKAVTVRATDDSGVRLSQSVAPSNTFNTLITNINGTLNVDFMADGKFNAELNRPIDAEPVYAPPVSTDLVMHGVKVSYTGPTPYTTSELNVVAAGVTSGNLVHYNGTDSGWTWHAVYDTAKETFTTFSLSHGLVRLEAVDVNGLSSFTNQKAETDIAFPCGTFLVYNSELSPVNFTSRYSDGYIGIPRSTMLGGGGARDAIEITMLLDGEHFYDITTDTTIPLERGIVPSADVLDTPVSANDGGFWRNEVLTVVDRDIPDVLIHEWEGN